MMSGYCSSNHISAADKTQIIEVEDPGSRSSKMMRYRTLISQSLDNESCSSYPAIYVPPSLDDEDQSKASSEPFSLRKRAPTKIVIKPQDMENRQQQSSTPPAGSPKKKMSKSNEQRADETYGIDTLGPAIEERRASSRQSTAASSVAATNLSAFSPLPKQRSKLYDSISSFNDGQFGTIAKEARQSISLGSLARLCRLRRDDDEQRQGEELLLDEKVLTHRQSDSYLHMTEDEEDVNTFRINKSKFRSGLGLFKAFGSKNRTQQMEKIPASPLTPPRPLAHAPSARSSPLSPNTLEVASWRLATSPLDHPDTSIDGIFASSSSSFYATSRMQANAQSTISLSNNSNTDDAFLFMPPRSPVRQRTKSSPSRPKTSPSLSPPMPILPKRFDSLSMTGHDTTKGGSTSTFDGQIGGMSPDSSAGWSTSASSMLLLDESTQSISRINPASMNESNAISPSRKSSSLSIKETKEYIRNDTSATATALGLSGLQGIVNELGIVNEAEMENMVGASKIRRKSKTLSPPLRPPPTYALPDIPKQQQQ